MRYWRSSDSPDHVSSFSHIPRRFHRAMGKIAPSEFVAKEKSLSALDSLPPLPGLGIAIHIEPLVTTDSDCRPAGTRTHARRKGRYVTLSGSLGEDPMRGFELTYRVAS